MRRLSLTKLQRQSAAGAELLSLCQTVTEDGSLSDEEVTALREWLDRNAAADLPARAFLGETVERIIADGKVTAEERDELYLAVEAVLPADIRGSVRAKRRTREEAAEQARRVERGRREPLGSWDFMVAGVRHEGRPAVIARYVRSGQRLFVIRDRANRFSRNAVEVRLGNGMQVGFVPEEYAAEMAPLLDEGCVHTAYVKKILGRGAYPIPVVVAELYHPDAGRQDLTAERSVPAKVAAPASAGCLSSLALLVTGLSVTSFIAIVACT